MTDHRLAQTFMHIMNRLFSLITVALLSGVILSSCVPYDEYGRRIEPKKKPTTNPTTLTPQQQEIEKKREELLLKDEERKKQEAMAGGSPTESPKTTTGDFEGGITPVEPTKQPAPPKNHPVAQAVPGKPGFVFSPFNNKVVDVRGIASGTLVADPQYPAAEKKHFRVP
jgi:hypothetical protein